MCRGWGRGTHALPSILSEEIVLKFAKFLSNPLLFFSHFLKVFQEFWSKRGKKKKGKKIELKSESSQLQRTCKSVGVVDTGRSTRVPKPLRELRARGSGCFPCSETLATPLAPATCTFFGPVKSQGALS